MKIFCDFDGTVAINDVGDLLFETFTNKRWKKAVEDWKNGLITSKECLIRECSLTRVTRKELEQYSDGQKLDPYFKDFVNYCQKKGYPIIILSDGMDFYIERILRNHNLEFLEFYSNKLIFKDENKIYPEFPYYEKGCKICGNCKGYHIRRKRTDQERVVYVGDGYSDRCGVKEADIIFAKGDLANYCRENNIDYYEFTNFKDVWGKVMELEEKPDRTLNTPEMGEDNKV